MAFSIELSGSMNIVFTQKSRSAKAWILSVNTMSDLKTYLVCKFKRYYPLPAGDGYSEITV